MGSGTFEAATHVYRINGRIVPNVTKVLSDVLPSFRASDWHLQRGRAVHACAALVAKGIEFEHDPRIAGQVEAMRRFFREVAPEIVEVEERVYSDRYLYAGTLDMAAIVLHKGKRRFCVFDYKASVGPSTIFQVAAYALASPRPTNLGCGVEIHDDGTYTMTEIWDLTRPKQEWLHLLGAYRIRERLGFTNKENGNHE